jgi:Mrp family chromosome partitioning ATPase
MSVIAQVSEVCAERRQVAYRNHPYCQYFDALLRRLQAANNGTPAPKTIGITACASGEGVSTVAANLAIRAADVGSEPVLLIDANTRRPAQEHIFGLGPGPGWANVATSKTGFADCVTGCEVEGLSILRAGVGSGSIGTMADCLQAVREQYRLIVIDLPPADELSPLWELGKQIDGVVLIIEAEKTRSGAAQRVRRQLTECHIPLLGVVLNKRRTYVPDWLYRRL